MQHKGFEVFEVDLDGLALSCFLLVIILCIDIILINFKGGGLSEPPPCEPPCNYHYSKLQTLVLIAPEV